VILAIFAVLSLCALWLGHKRGLAVWRDVLPLAVGAAFAAVGTWPLALIGEIRSPVLIAMVAGLLALIGDRIAKAILNI
jgi:uncharacterized membrane protein YfcA